MEIEGTVREADLIYEIDGENRMNLATDDR
jgi:hypothetical protein